MKYTSIFYIRKCMVFENFYILETLWVGAFVVEKFL